MFETENGEHCKRNRCSQKDKYVRMISDLMFWNYNGEFWEYVYLRNSEDLYRWTSSKRYWPVPVFALKQIAERL